MSVVNHYQGLQPCQDTYSKNCGVRIELCCLKLRLNFILAFNDGTPMELVNLSGTIPVRFKGSIYNIPICIWLIDTHPKNAPICYVKPTSDMSIKVSMFVDQNGKIYLPYLHDWLPVKYT